MIHFLLYPPIYPRILSTSSASTVRILPSIWAPTDPGFDVARYWLRAVVGTDHSDGQLSQIFADTVMAWAVQSTGMLCTLLFTGLVHTRMANGTPETAVEHYLYLKGTKLLNEQLADSTQPARESTLWYVIALALFGQGEEPMTDKAPRQSLKELQNLHILGVRRPIEVYLQQVGLMIASIGLSNLVMAPLYS
jgi:hypothetical protein